MLADGLHALYAQALNGGGRVHRACDQQVAGRRSGLLCTLTIRAFMNSRRYLQHTCICMKMVKSNSGVHSALHPLVHLALCTVQSGYIESCPAYSWSSLVSMQTKDEIEANVLTVARERWWFRTTASSNGPQQLRFIESSTLSTVPLYSFCW